MPAGQSVRQPLAELKMGKFELDNIVSEKRGLTLSANGGGYQLYHFIPVGDSNSSGRSAITSLGWKWLDTRRTTEPVFRPSCRAQYRWQSGPAWKQHLQRILCGQPGLRSGQAWDPACRLLCHGGTGADQYSDDYERGVTTPVPGGGFGNKTFSREGFAGIFYLGKLDFQVVPSTVRTMLTSAPALRSVDRRPSDGARSAVWNGAFVETHYVYNPQLVFIQRSEWIRMSQQAIPGTPSNLGNIDNYVFGYRYMPVHDQPRRFRLSQRVLVDPSTRNCAGRIPT